LTRYGMAPAPKLARLLVDIVGVILLFKYGLPSQSIRDTGVFEAYDPQETSRYDRWSDVALISLIVGFALQIVSTFV
jgi:hypothetical protein